MGSPSSQSLPSPICLAFQRQNGLGHQNKHWDINRRFHYFPPDADARSAELLWFRRNSSWFTYYRFLERKTGHYAPNASHKKPRRSEV